MVGDFPREASHDVSQVQLGDVRSEGVHRRKIERRTTHTHTDRERRVRRTWYRQRGGRERERVERERESECARVCEEEGERETKKVGREGV